MSTLRNIVLAVSALAAGLTAASASAADQELSVVLVHGGFVDGSGWQPVHQRLVRDGFEVIVVQNPTISLADDVAVTRRAIAGAKYPVVLVGHSYGGAVISEAGNDPKVKSLSFIAAFPPESGESVESLIGTFAPDAPKPPIVAPKDGFLALDREKFAAAFAGDVDPQIARFMADSQVPWGVAALSGKVNVPAWKTKPSTYLVATEDLMIPPATQRAMAARAKARVIEVKGSHAISLSQPDAVVEAIKEAAKLAR